jgi:pilus assembly protein CpaB
MRMKSLILIFIALGCGLVASIGISQVMDRGGGSGSMEMEQILVALVDIDISSKLDDKNVKLEDWPKAKIPEGAIRRLDDITGKFANSRFFKGEPIHTSKITDSPDSTASKIPDGYRALPVKVDEDTVMKAIAPGDRVDVMVFLKKDLNNGISETGAFPILKNVRVFAVNTNTERSNESSGKGESSMFRTVSLLLKPEHTRELVVAARVGKIVLTLRSPDEQDKEGGEEALSISEILKGTSDLASEPVEPGSTSPQPGHFNSLPTTPGNAKVAWRMIVTGPNGADQYQWTDTMQLPTKTHSAAPPAEESLPSGDGGPEDGSTPPPAGNGNGGSS